MTSKRPVDGSERRKTGRRSALKLHPTAEAARVEALEHLGDAAVDFTAAISRYVNAVNVAATARAEWERLDRPMMHRFWNGAEGIHPLIQTMERLDRAAAQFGASLGLDPMSARRLGRVGRLGRPAGANSAPDRWMPEPLRVARRVDDLPKLKVKGEEPAPVSTPGPQAPRAY